MPPSLEHVDACLPVAALKALNLGGEALILQGQGPFANVIDDSTGKVLAKARTFRRNNVHGFIVLNRTQHSEGKEDVQIVVWGGESVRLLSLSLDRGSTSGDLEVAFHTASAEYLAPDWILAGCAPQSNGQIAYMVTAHNSILGLSVIDEYSSRYKRGIYIKQLVAGVRTLLYSADNVSLSASRILVSAGTVFGEVIVWSCFLDETDIFGSGAVSSIHHFFTGHEGSVFGVRISDAIPSLPGSSSRLLASCSDDRTVRVWDISDCEGVSRDDPSAYSTDGFDLRSTGFGSVAANGDGLESESCIASAYGHKARIWDVQFLHLPSGNHNSLNLVSRGEDATCVLWNLHWGSSPADGSAYHLDNKTSYHLHAGKHIWSMDVRNVDSEFIIYTGGADGALKSFQLRVDDTGALILPNRDTSITEFIDDHDAVKPTEKSMRMFTFINSDYFLGTTVQGEVQICHFESGGSTGPRIRKETLCLAEDLRSFCSMSSLPQHGLVLLGGPTGSIRLYNHQTKTLIPITNTGRLPQLISALDCEFSSSGILEEVYFVVSYADNAELFTVRFSPNAELQVDTIQLLLPTKRFVVLSASLLHDKKYLALGSKFGYFAIYQCAKSDSIQKAAWFDKVHPPDGVNHIIKCSSFFGTPGALPGCFMTAGRDGKYCMHELHTDGGSGNSISVETIHRSLPPVDIAVDGVYVDNVSQDLMLYGFCGGDFILWNESTQSEVARVPCGGSRRIWAFQPSLEQAWGGTFIWLQVHFRAVQIQGNAQRTLRVGGHGREIKAMSASQAAGGEGGPLFVTGGEDTLLRVYAPTSPGNEGLCGTVKCMRVLKEHHSGLQEIGWSNDGKFLFTSGGMEEFLAWRVRSLPYFGIATCLEARSPMDDPNSELRVTSFDMLEVDGEQGEGDFLICLTYSNSKLKIFHYSSSPNEGTFTLLARGTYTSNCLTQARFILRGSSLGLITAATDGYFTFWDLTPTIEPYYSISSGLRAKQPIRTSSTTEGDIACENRYQIHSNSIKCLEIVEVSRTFSLIIAGGDDNALSFSLLSTNLASTDPTSGAITVTIPDAHAACISTIKILEQVGSNSSETMQLTMASSGNDHRVKLWRIEVDTTKGGHEGIQVTNQVDKYTAVADISALDVVRLESGMANLVVCGVGMEIFKIQLH
ncbi:hypothetical protein FE257_001230 [Aspergillus nanangensis]|uniref:WD repeat protein n=1 Tax=Aspergillus nanangensis TaxID=2582783 RepID=A0AAD4CE55_ASPNN|nr:hypothetical protein FE257_001230 [Aspergillus nanangensis]